MSGSPFLSNYSTLTDIDSNGVLVYMRYSSTATDGTALLDMNPTTTYRADRGIKWSGNVGKFADAILPVNRTFTWDNLQITPLGTTPSGAMRVSVTRSASYVAWTRRTFDKPLTDVVTDHDPDGDGVTNFMEFAFGTDPTLSDAGQSAANGAGKGKPIPRKSGAGGVDLQFVRRTDHGNSGSLKYTVQFSSDLVTFYDDTTLPTWVADSATDPDYEVVKVPYPTSPLPDGGRAAFGRVNITHVP